MNPVETESGLIVPSHALPTRPETEQVAGVLAGIIERNNKDRGRKKTDAQRKVKDVDSLLLILQTLAQANQQMERFIAYKMNEAAENAARAEAEERRIIS
jgi:hypothetical protein